MPSAWRDSENSAKLLVMSRDTIKCSISTLMRGSRAIFLVELKLYNCFLGQAQCAESHGFSLCRWKIDIVKSRHRNLTEVFIAITCQRTISRITSTIPLYNL